MSTLKHLVSEKLNIPVLQQWLLFKGKALADGKRLSNYSIEPNSKLNLVVKPLEKVLLEESTVRKTAEAPARMPAAWPLISRVLAGISVPPMPAESWINSSGIMSGP